MKMEGAAHSNSHSISIEFQCIHTDHNCYLLEKKKKGALMTLNLITSETCKRDDVLITA